ncbi:MAG: PTS transporter subunit EIIC [Erysipelotrichaceae bacterium]|nr:PTS transporter subunit EIIC [Erysipelotrichaceae bacterium]
MDYKKTAASIVELVGGKENIEAHTHCMTRLRLVLADRSKAKEEELKKVPGIQGVVYKGGQYQIVIGPDVEQLYNELAPLVPNAEAQEKIKENLDEEKESIWNQALSYISGSVTPALPVLIGSGMISAILALCANLLKVNTAGSTYQLFNALANAAYTYLPVLVAFAAARRLKTNEYVAAFIMLALCTGAISGVADLTIFGIKLTTVKYTSNIVPALLMVPVMAFIDRYVVKYSPKSIVSIIRPTILSVIMFPLTLLLLGPIGTWIGSALANFCVWITSFGGVSMVILSALHPLLVMVGMHTVITPLIVNEITTYGSSLLFSKALAGNLAIAGAALAVGIKAKKAENKSAGLSTGVTALLSVTEPALYGVLIRLKRPLIGALIGAAITGLFIGIFDVRAYATASCSFLTLPIFMGGDSMKNFYLAVAAAIIATVLGFIATWIIGFKEDE